MYMTLKIQLPPEIPPLNGQDVRPLVAELIDGKPKLAKALLHLEEHNGTTRHKNGLAPVRFNRIGPSRLAIHCVGQNACKDVGEQTGDLHACFLKRFPEGVRMDVQYGNCTIRPTERMRGYYFPALIWQKNGGQELARKCQMDKNCPELIELLRAKIPEWIGRQCDLVGEEPPDDFIIGHIEILKTVPIKVHNTWRHCVKATVEMPAQLGGPWHLGHVASRGFGLATDSNTLTRIPKRP